MTAYLVMVGAGLMALNNVELFNMAKELLQFYDVPREKAETKFGKPVKMDFHKDRLLTFTCSVGDPRQKRFMIEELGRTIFNPIFINFIHQTVIKPNSVKTGVGVTIQPYVSLRRNNNIGNHVMICGHSNIGHDTTIGDYCTIGPSAVIPGNCHIGEGVLLGAGCVLKPGTTIGEGSIIGEGSVVTKPVPPNEAWVGNPAKKLKELSPWL